MPIDAGSGLWRPLPIAIVGAGAALFLGLAWVLAILGRARARGELRRARDELSRAEAQSREQSRQTSRMRSEQRSLSNFLRLLPTAVEKLNSDEVGTRSIHQLILQMTSAIFEPEQMLLYVVRNPDKSDPSSGRLHLVGHHGLAHVPERVKEIGFGEGKIGWVAENRIDMIDEDWSNHVRTAGTPPQDDHPALRLDLLCPLVHRRDRGHTETYGVLCVGGPSVRLRDEKLMLQMIANLGSIALTHARNVHNLKSRADHDGLTGLMNKQKFMESLGLMINAAEREMQPIGLFMFDIDHFKAYNDTNGHMAGDELLKRIARVIRDNLRPGDVPCRYGGEEFLVAMPDTDPKDAHTAAERIRAAIETTPFAHGESQPLGRLTISGGVAAFPVDGTNSTDLVRHADQALYRAKAAGRNRVLRYEGVQIGDVDDDLGYGDDHDELFGDPDPLISPDAVVPDPATGTSWER